MAGVISVGRWLRPRQDAPGAAQHGSLEQSHRIVNGEWGMGTLRSLRSRGCVWRSCSHVACMIEESVDAEH